LTCPRGGRRESGAFARATASVGGGCFTRLSWGFADQRCGLETARPRTGRRRGGVIPRTPGGVKPVLRIFSRGGAAAARAPSPRGIAQRRRPPTRDVGG